MAFPWSLRRDRAVRLLGRAVLVLLISGGSAVRLVDLPQPRVAQAAARRSDPATLRPTASVRPSGDVVVAPVIRPSRQTARRAAELVAAQQCRNIKRPRYHRVDASADSDDGRTATFVVGRASDTPRKSAGFVLRLAWREGEYVGRVSEAYGGCARG